MLLAAEKMQPFNKLFSFDEAVEIVFVSKPPISLGSEILGPPHLPAAEIVQDYPYKLEGKPMKIDLTLKQILTSIENSTVGESTVPYFGSDLGSVAVFDKKGNPICILTVVVGTFTKFSVCDAKVLDKKILRGDEDIYLVGKSKVFAKWMNDQVKRQNSKKSNKTLHTNP